MLLLDSEAISALARGPAGRREHAVDSFIIAVADLAGGAIVATVDTSDLDALAGFASNVTIADIGA